MMKLCTGLLLVVGVLWSGPLLAKAEVTTEDLGWLSGTWINSEAGIVEQFTPPGGGMILGTSRIVEEGIVSFFEFMKFEDGEGGLTLTPYVFGSQGVSFVVSEHKPGLVEFVNESNDFPSLIRYERGGTELKPTLIIHVFGTQEGQPIELNFTLTKSATNQTN